MVDQPLLIAGHSHSVAMGVTTLANGSPPRITELPFAGLEAVALSGAWPRSEDYWSTLLDEAERRSVALVWGGSQHVATFLFAPDPLFDFVLSSEPDRPLDPTLPTLPEALVREMFATQLVELERLLVALRKTARGQVLVCGTPPPKGDPRKVRDLLLEEPFFVEQARMRGFDPNALALTPLPILYKLWALVQVMMRERAEAAGARFVAVPECTRTPEGFLDPAYWLNDITHANSDFGRLMIETLLDASRGSTPALLPKSYLNPYRQLPDRQYWSRGVSKAYDPAMVGTFASPLLRRDDLVISAGSCFASNLVPYLEESGFHYLRTETRHPLFAACPADNYSYDKFSAQYGNIYSVRQLLQLLRRARGTFRPVEDRWIEAGRIVDPYRPGLRYPACSEAEFERVTEQHLDATLRAFRDCTVFIFTLGLTEAWFSKSDGAVFPACPGTIAGVFDPDCHHFINFSVEEVMADLDAAIAEFHEINPAARIILTVSPVPLVATATRKHVLSATVYSKSVLRVAAEHAADTHAFVSYFPSFEIVTGSTAPPTFFEDDRRHVTKEAVDVVMRAFLSRCETGSPRAEPPSEQIPERASASSLAQVLAAFECEEAGQDARS